MYYKKNSVLTSIYTDVMANKTLKEIIVILLNVYCSCSHSSYTTKKNIIFC